jgi:hypothetical protein
MANSICLSDKWRTCDVCARLTNEGHREMVSDFNRSGTRKWRRDKASVDDFSMGWQLQAVRQRQWQFLTPEAADMYGHRAVA